MVYWFTGQPSAGKTVLSKRLHAHFDYEPFLIDGDDMRELFSNKDYTIKGRVENVGTAQRIAHFLFNKGKDVIVALVSPYIDQREDFKDLLGDNIKEIYVHTTEKRERDHFHVKDYEAPEVEFIDVDTTKDNPDKSFSKIINHLTKLKKI